MCKQSAITSFLKKLQDHVLSAGLPIAVERVSQDYSNYNITRNYIQRNSQLKNGIVILTKYDRKVSLDIGTGVIDINIFNFSHSSKWRCTVCRPRFSNRWKQTLPFDALYLKRVRYKNPKFDGNYKYDIINY